ncbi:hypothetical protein BU23DRAFT_579864 [Bimuria novae-zelandiae CBS 107.79]|uniref:Geranylgeranyl pyrophosphate synthetase n=1 Tax=Bimuria novae-zelandiae CBS 107.79 TaxID=1447943 RepID=A0A6A5VBP4_9PLEO|nr:hypothetical protein BU23DRAFT_579864 [Bimuria novae-zelandiae CBS 107.79]
MYIRKLMIGSNSDLDAQATVTEYVRKSVGQCEATIFSHEGHSNAAATCGATDWNTRKSFASYNWTDAKSPIILVPGKPPLWTPLRQAQRLKEDSGVFFRDLNSAKYPEFPTEPAVRALLDTDPIFAIEEVDVFACGSTMGNLLRFARSIEKPFRFNIELIGTTVFFVRKDNDPREIIEGVRGYGHTFPEAYTTWERDVKGSESHQRLCRYKFGGLDCVVRFECDGYLGHGSGPAPRSNPVSTPAGLLDSLVGSLDNVTVGRHISDSKTALTLKQSGAVVPQHTVFDLKTRSGKYRKEIDMEEMYPQLWIKQIPNFVVAYHDGYGTFPLHDIHVKQVQANVQAWERQNEAAIRRLAVLLNKFVEIAKKEGPGLLEAYCPSVDRLEIRRQHGEGVHALPPELMARWTVELDLSDHEHDHESEHGGVQLSYDSDSDSEKDLTACGEDCGYCGKCTY